MSMSAGVLYAHTFFTGQSNEIDTCISYAGACFTYIQNKSQSFGLVLREHFSETQSTGKMPLRSGSSIFVFNRSFTIPTSERYLVPKNGFMKRMAITIKN
jgi:hypothetical protein